MRSICSILLTFPQKNVFKVVNYYSRFPVTQEFKPLADYESRLNIYFCSLKNESIVRVFRHTFWKCDKTPSCIIFLKSIFLNELFWIAIFSQDYCINNQNWLHLCLVPCQSPCLNTPRKFKNGPAPQVLKKPGSNPPWHNKKRRVCITSGWTLCT